MRKSTIEEVSRMPKNTAILINGKLYIKDFDGKDKELAEMFITFHSINDSEIYVLENEDLERMIEQLKSCIQ